MNRFAASLACLFIAAPLGAHPHIFVDTGVDLYFTPDGTLSEVKVTWRYDAFYSLLITQDMGIDFDGDGLLTDQEQALLDGFDMQWSDGFNGDLTIEAGGMPVALSRPRDYSAAYVLGRITTIHTRDVLSSNVGADLLYVRPFDLTYYTAYDVSFPVTVHGIPDCQSQIVEPEQTPALAAIREKIGGLPMDVDPADVGLSDVGALLATTVVLSCAAS
jgi:ABC-type uncharacterized transport system substrate-binding protein